MKQLIRKILREEAEDEITNVSPEELYNVLDYVSDDMELLAKSQLLGKKLRITGNLDLANRKGITTLGNIVQVNGDLDVAYTNIESLNGVKISGDLNISYTKISSLEGVIVGGKVRDYQSTLWRINERRKKQKLFDEAEQRREAKEWDLDNSDIDEIGLRANAVLKFINENNLTEIKTEDDYENLNDLNARLENVNIRLQDMENNGEDTTTIEEEIQELEDAITEINEKFDQYFLIPNGEYYDMTEFLAIDGALTDERFVVGTRYEFDSALESYIKQMIEDEGVKTFSRGYLESNIDKDAVEELAISIYSNIYDEPEYYFDEDDYELSDELKEKLENVEDLINDYELEQRLLDRNNPNWEEKYDELQEKLDELYEQKEDIESNKEITQKMIEEKIDERVEEAVDNAVNFLNEYGIDIAEYVDIDGLVEDIARDSSPSEWFPMKSQLYDVLNVDGNEYFVFQLD